MEVSFFDEALKKFIGSLERETTAKVFYMIGLLERFGNLLGMPHSKNIGAQLLELRVRGKQEVRILYTFHHGRAVLLRGFIKKSERIPAKELELASHRRRLLV